MAFSMMSMDPFIFSRYYFFIRSVIITAYLKFGDIFYIWVPKEIVALFFIADDIGLYLV